MEEEEKWEYSEDCEGGQEEEVQAEVGEVVE